MKILLISAILLLPFLANAQTEARKDYPMWRISEDKIDRIFSNTAYIRSEPDIDGKLVDSLKMGDALKIEYFTKSYYSAKGMYAAWAKVSYSKYGHNQDGYVWLGNVALGSAEDNETLYMYGIDNAIINKKDPEYLQLQYNISIVAKSKLNDAISKKTWIINDDESLSYHEIKLLGDTKLKNVRQVARFMHSGEACGIPSVYFYAAYTGSSLLDLPGKYSVGDAGIFSHTETLLFPNEIGGKPDKIIKLISEEEYEEDEKTNNIRKLSSFKKKIVYEWNGKSATQIR